MKFKEELFNKQKDTFKNSTWVNNTDYTAKFMLLTDVEQGRSIDGKPVQNGVARAVKLAPGEEITLESRYDDAIRTIEKDFENKIIQGGKVVGGLCPWLSRKEDADESPELMDCLDFVFVIEEEKTKKLSVTLAKEKALAEARAVIAKEKAELEVLLANKEPQINKGGRPKKSVD